MRGILLWISIPSVQLTFLRDRDGSGLTSERNKSEAKDDEINDRRRIN